MIYDFITVGGSTRDITFFTDEGILIDNRQDLLRQELLAFEQGAKFKIDQFHYLFGGGAANSAVNFARSGFKVACLSRVGRDEHGLAVRDNLRNSGVMVPFLQKDYKRPTGFSFILVSPGGERIIFSNRSANENLELNKAALAAAGQVKWIYVSSLSDNWRQLLKPLFLLKKPRIAWNPGGGQYKGGLRQITWFLKRTDLFLLNHDEAIELVLSDSAYKNRPHKFFNQVKNLLPVIKSYGPKIVVITRGAKGADAYDGHQFYHQDTFKEKKRVDTTGVGDVFNSSVVAGLEISGDNLKKALRAAARNAALKITQLGAQNGQQDLRKLIK